MWNMVKTKSKRSTKKEIYIYAHLLPTVIVLEDAVRQDKCSSEADPEGTPFSLRIVLHGKSCRAVIDGASVKLYHAR